MRIQKFNHVSTLSNAGQAAQQNLDFAITGKIRKPDNVPFDMDSDIPEYGISVKSARFTLVSASALSATTFEGQLAEYIERVHSREIAYVTKSDVAYIMTLPEFVTFCTLFCTMQKESEKNGGGYKVRCKTESKKMLAWFEAHI